MSRAEHLIENALTDINYLDLEGYIYMEILRGNATSDERELLEMIYEIAGYIHEYYERR